MIIATLTKIVSSVAVAGALATAAFVIAPAPTSVRGVWLDTPLDNAIVDAGDVQVVLHSDLPNVLSIYVDVVLNGATVATLRDSELERVQHGVGAEPLSVFDQVWSVSTPGIYTLKVSVSGSTETRRSFTVIVLEQGPVSVDTAEGTTAPTPTPTPEPTEEVVEPEGPSGPLIAGSVNRFQPDDNDWLSYFYLNSFSPVEATTAIEIRITDTLNNVTGEWQSYPCYGNVNTGSPGLFNCVISNHLIEPPASFQIDGNWLPFSVEFRGAITSEGETVYAPGGTWTTARRSAG